MKASLLAAAALSVALVLPGQALAWGAMGHRIVGEAAMRALPPEVPAFLRTPTAVRDVGELSREQDRSKGAGRIHDHNRDAGHFLDLDEQGKLLGGPALLPLPSTRADYEKGLQAAGLDSWKAGYLPYSIVDRHQQLAKDFAYWRVLKHMAAKEKNPVRRAWYARDLVHRRPVAFRRRWFAAVARHRALQWLGRVREPERLYDRQGAWSVRERVRIRQRETCRCRR
jgi:hypothetical protein